jgi:DNA-binding response OmpR family regulator
MLQAHTPDLLITDVRLGAHNGLELVLRARGGAADMPAII